VSKEESTSFLKKRSKKLLFAVADFRSARAKKHKSFLVLFFKKEHSFLLFLVFAGPALAVSDPREMLPDPAQEARAEAVGSQLRCLVCQNESIEDSNANLAKDLRAKVREQVKEGRTDAQIIAWMVARYGTFVRLRPPLNAATVLLYATPVLALLAGGLAAFFGRARQAAAPAPLSEAERQKLAELGVPRG
jgi:cytochrome c-type biogenesis protein CcmH